jgi:hypothetical protein
MSNAALLSSIENTYDKCVQLLKAIVAKPATKFFTYIVRIPNEKSSPVVRIDDPKAPAAAAGTGAGGAGGPHRGQQLQAVVNPFCDFQGYPQQQYYGAADVSTGKAAQPQLVQLARPVLVAEEIVITQASEKILNELTIDVRLQAVDDFFNDRLDYT